MRRPADGGAARPADAGQVLARLPKLALLFSVLAAVSAAYLAVPGTAQPARARTTTVELTTLDRGVLQQLNAIRKLRGLAPLTLDTSLGHSASQHSIEMGLKGYFEHNSADGTI